MVIDSKKEIDGDELKDFLASRETGVLSLAQENDPYSIPISFGFDSENAVFYLRLVSTPQSKKREYLSSSPNVALVVYDQMDNTYESVIAKGELIEIKPDDLTVENIEQYGEAQRPLFEIWGEDKPDLNVGLYKLVPDELSGRSVRVEINE